MSDKPIILQARGYARPAGALRSQLRILYPHHRETRVRRGTQVERPTCLHPNTTTAPQIFGQAFFLEK